MTELITPAAEVIAVIVEAIGIAIIVLIRTFLSVTLELELTGRWPWQKQEAAA